MNILKKVLQILLGVGLLIFGLNGFLNFIPFPQVGPEAGKFLSALGNTKSIFPLISIIETVAGVLLLVNKAKGLALVMVFPILLGAVLYHLALDPNGTGGAALFLILNVVLIVLNFDRFKELFK